MSWPKGISGNPSGRPKDKPITEALRRKLLENDAKALNTLINVWVAKAQSGDIQAIKEITDRIEGKPLQQIETTVTRTDISTLSDAEFADLIAAVRSAEAGNGSKPRGTKTNGKAEPDSVH